MSVLLVLLLLHVLCLRVLFWFWCLPLPVSLAIRETVDLHPVVIIHLFHFQLTRSELL